MDAKQIWLEARSQWRRADNPKFQTLSREEPYTRSGRSGTWHHIDNVRNVSKELALASVVRAFNLATSLRYTTATKVIRRYSEPKPIISNARKEYLEQVTPRMFRGEEYTPNKHAALIQLRSRLLSYKGGNKFKYDFNIPTPNLPKDKG